LAAPIIFAEEENLLLSTKIDEENHRIIYHTDLYGTFFGKLEGLYQLKNTNTLLSVINQLKKKEYRITSKNVHDGFAHVTKLTGFLGRWQRLSNQPTLVCDTGHNVAGITYIVNQLKKEKFNQLHFVIGMVNDKDINGMLTLLPQNALYYFTKADIPRALPENELMRAAHSLGLKGESYSNVVAAVHAAQGKSRPDDFIFVGGSTFLVGDLLKNYVTSLSE
jgi:dihydrofolate synthase/folylpolyglutamate synthase